MPKQLTPLLVVVTVTLFIAHTLGLLAKGVRAEDIDWQAKYLSQADKVVVLGQKSNQLNRTDWTGSGHRACHRYSCFDVLQCQINESKHLLYYVYPPIKLLAPNGSLIYSTRLNASLQFRLLINEILLSDRLTLNPNDACFFVPTIDLTSLAPRLDLSTLASLYDQLFYWRHIQEDQPGMNHLIVVLDSTLDLTTLSGGALFGKAMIVASQFDTWSLRPNFDLSIPDITESVGSVQKIADQPRHWQLIATQYGSLADGLYMSALERLQTLMGNDLLVLSYHCKLPENGKLDDTFIDDLFMRCDELWVPTLDNLQAASMTNCSFEATHKLTCRCSVDGQLDFKYPKILSTANFCLIFHLRTRQGSDGIPLGDASQFILAQALRFGCIPIVSTDYVLPLDTIIDWNSIAVRLTNPFQLETLHFVIKLMDSTERETRSKLAKAVWLRHWLRPEQLATDIFQHFDSFVYPPVLLTAGSDRPTNLSRYHYDIDENDL